MVNKKSWEEFRGTGLLLFVNTFLHIFGWSIVLEVTGERIGAVYPARVKFRGFDEASTSKAYQNLSKFLIENAQKLKQEADE